MTTNKTTTTTNQYDPGSMSRYNTGQNTLLNTYQSMVQNPYGGAAYNMGLQQNLGAANQLGANNVRNAMSNFSMSGTGNLTGGARASLLSGLGRQTSGLRQQGFFNNWNTATANQQFGANVLGQMQPLQTGQTQVQKTSGLGTWLPQLIGAGLGVAGAFATGGASLAAKGLGAGFAAGSGAISSLGGGQGQYGPSFGGSSAGGSFWNNISPTTPGWSAGAPNMWGQQISGSSSGGIQMPQVSGISRQ